MTNLKTFKRYALAVKHAEDVVVGLNKELRGIGKGVVLCKPFGLRVPVRTEQGKGSRLIIQRPCYASNVEFGGEKAIGVKKHESDCSFSCDFTKL